MEKQNFTDKSTVNNAKTKINTDTNQQNINKTNKPEINKKNKEEQKGDKRNDFKSIISTNKRTSLIDPNEKMNIKDLRTKNLYDELQRINSERYVNVTSVSLRSLLEFSVNCFLERKKSTWAYNSNITLMYKIKKV